MGGEGKEEGFLGRVLWGFDAFPFSLFPKSHDLIPPPPPFQSAPACCPPPPSSAGDIEGGGFNPFHLSDHVGFFPFLLLSISFYYRRGTLRTNNSDIYALFFIV